MCTVTSNYDLLLTKNLHGHLNRCHMTTSLLLSLNSAFKKSLRIMYGYVAARENSNHNSISWNYLRSFFFPSRIWKESPVICLLSPRREVRMLWSPEQCLAVVITNHTDSANHVTYKGHARSSYHCGILAVSPHNSLENTCSEEQSIGYLEKDIHWCHLWFYLFGQGA